MSQQLSDCCKAPINLDSTKERPECYTCSVCGRVIGSPLPDTNHTDSVEAGWKEKLKHGLLNQSCERSGDGITAYYRIGQTSTQEWLETFIEELLTTLQATHSQQVEEAVRKERERIWHEVSLKTPSLSANWPKGATYNSGKIEGWNVCKSFIKSVLTPNHQD